MVKRQIAWLLVVCTILGLGIGVAGANPKEIKLKYWVDPRLRQIEGMEDVTSLPGDYERIQAEEFMKLHPHVSIEVEVIPFEDLTVRIPAAVAAGAAPDLLRDYLGRTAQYWHQGVLEPLEDLIPEDEKADYLPGFLDMYTLDGHMHALPVYAWAGHLAANKEIWEEKDVAELLPTDSLDWTVTEFEKALYAVKEDNLWPMGLFVPPDGQADYRYLAFFWIFGAKLYENGDYSRVALNTPAGIEALEFLVHLSDEDLIQPGATTMTSAQLDSMLWRGEIGILGNTLAIWKGYENAKRDGKVTRDIELVPLPYPYKEGTQSPGLAVGPTGIAIFKQKDPEKLKWAVEFARFLNRPEYQRVYAQNAGQFPTRISTGNPFGDDPNYAAVQYMLNEYGVEDLGVTSPKYNQVRALLSKEIQSALVHLKSPEKALADFEREANRQLSR